MSNILIVDDIAKNIQLIANVLKEFNYNLFFARNAYEAYDVLEKNTINLILLDVMMPEVDGFSAAKVIKSNDKDKDIPIIFITAKNDDESILKAYEVGGVDYITKPFRNVEFITRVRTHLEIAHLNQKLKDQASAMKELASTDTLTKIPNRLKFNSIFEYQIKISKRYKKSLSLIFFDIDFFKKFNDNYGHSVGDIVLIELSKKVNSCLREADALCRWGGEEFVIILPETTDVTAFETAQKLRECISKMKIDNKYTLTCSFGVSTLKEGDYSHTFLTRADDALYKAKNNGRNRVEVLL